MGTALARSMSTNGTYTRDNDISDSCVLAYKTAPLGFSPYLHKEKIKSFALPRNILWNYKNDTG